MSNISDQAHTMMKPVFRASTAFQAFLEDVRVLGIVAGGVSATNYGVIAARSNERYWLAQLRPRAAAKAGFAFFHPVTRATALVKVIAMTVVQLGLWPLLARNRIALDSSNLVSDYFERPVVHLAFFTGTNGPHRKTAIEFIDAYGAILGYAKCTRRPHIAAYLRAEAEALRRLEGLALESVDVPRCLTFEETGEYALLVTDSQKSGRSVSPKVMTTAHAEFLLEIARKTKRDADDGLRSKLAARLHSASAGSPKAWRTRFETGLNILGHPNFRLQLALGHGDFTPWNCFMEEGRLYVFDWEYSDPATPLGYDVMKFLSSQQGNVEPETMGNQVIARIAELYFDGQIPDAKAHYHLGLLLHSAFYIERAREQGESFANWQEETQFAALVEVEERRDRSW